MKEFDCDLHFHGLYSGGVSSKMEIPVIAQQARLKGLEVAGTADILHSKWLEHVRKSLGEEENGVFRAGNGIAFILQTEVQCIDSVHHIIFFPDFAAVAAAKEKLKPFSSDMDSFGGGRPRIRLKAERIAEIVVDAGGIIGPAHAFTPYFGVLAHFDSLKQCYGKMFEEVKFMELGLSADSYFADLIEENHKFQFITASDGHSPWPWRIGREFTRIRMREPSFKELKKALERKDEKLVTLNAGLDPREGKYHCSACNKCFARFSLEQASSFKWRCPACKGTIKKGVRHRIMELANFKEETHPEFRPPYLHLLPLAEIIQNSLGVQNITSARVQELWQRFVERAGSEIKALVDVPVGELEEVDRKIAQKINAFREGWVLFIPGGGGEYGKPLVCDSELEFRRKKAELGKKLECYYEAGGQRKLSEF